MPTYSYLYIGTDGNVVIELFKTKQKNQKNER